MTALPLMMALTACGSESSSPGAPVTVTASGEALATSGFRFPPSQGAPSFVDGWEVRYDHVIVTFADVRMTESPDLSPTEPAALGETVARLDGAWAVELSQLRPSDEGVVQGRSGPNELALELGVMPERADGKPFEADQRYGFSFDVVPAQEGAVRLGFDDEANAIYERMVKAGHTTVVRGTATWKGDPSSCKSSDPGYDFGKLPTTVRFELAFKTDVKNLNCQNPDNDPARALPGEESLRGVYVDENRPTTAQMTLHTDHLFWDSLEHNSRLHFDHYAARAREVDGEWVVTLADMVEQDLTAMTDRDGEALPWRSCVDSSQWIMPTVPSQVWMDDSEFGLQSFGEYVTFAAATMGHLNGSGLCFVPGFEHRH